MKLRMLFFLLLFPILTLVMPAEAQAQTPDITGTWTGTATVNSAVGVESLTVTLVVSSETGGNFTGTVQIDTSEEGPTTIYGHIASLLSLWQLHGVGATDYGLPMRVQGFFTPAVILVSPASITLDSEYGAYWPLDDGIQQFDFPLVFHVTLTKS